MNILRVPTVALTIVLFTMGSLILPVNTALAHCKGRHADVPGLPDCLLPHGGGGDDPGFPTDMTVELSNGAFVFDQPPPPVGVTVESETKLSGNDDVSMTRPGGPVPVTVPPTLVCTKDDPATDALCLVWNSVFDLCHLLGDPPNVQVPGFPIMAGRKGWTVQKVVDEVWVALEFPLVSPLEPDDELYTDRLSAGMQLKGDCTALSCKLIPDGVMGFPSTLVYSLTDYSIHLRGQGGVTHKADCHAGDSDTNLGWGGHAITLTITRPALP